MCFYWKPKLLNNLLAFFVSGLILFGYTPYLSGQCSEQGNYIICEDWDSGNPPSGWPDKGDDSWNGWTPADYGNVASNSGDISSDTYNSGGRSLVLIKGDGYKGVSDLQHSIPGNPSRIFVRFYLNIPPGQVANLGSFAHVIFLNTASSAEVALDFRKCGEVNSGYYDCHGLHNLAIHSYSPEVSIANNQDSRGNRNYFVWEDHEGEWVCVEWMVDFANDLTSLWINGEPHVTDFPMDFDYSGASSIILSGFTQETSGTINYYYDDVVVSTNYIGLRGQTPPSLPPNPPENLMLLETPIFDQR